MSNADEIRAELQRKYTEHFAELQRKHDEDLKKLDAPVPAASAGAVPAAVQGVATTVRTGPVPAPGQGVATTVRTGPAPAARQGVATTVRTGPVPAPGQGVANTASARVVPAPGPVPAPGQGVATTVRTGPVPAPGQGVATTVRTGPVPAPGQGVANTARAGVVPAPGPVPAPGQGVAKDASAGAESAAEISALCDRIGKKVGGKVPLCVGADRSVGGKGTGVVGGGKHMNDEREQDSDEEDESEDGDDEDYKDEDDDDDEDSDKMNTEDDDEGDGCAENADVLCGFTIVKRFNKKDKNGWTCIEPIIDEDGCPTTCGTFLEKGKTLKTTIANHMRNRHKKLLETHPKYKSLLEGSSKTKQTRKKVSKQNHSAEEVSFSEDDMPEEDHSSATQLRKRDMEINALKAALDRADSSKNNILTLVDNFVKNLLALVGQHGQQVAPPRPSRHSDLLPNGARGNADNKRKAGAVESKDKKSKIHSGEGGSSSREGGSASKKPKNRSGEGGSSSREGGSASKKPKNRSGEGGSNSRLSANHEESLDCTVVNCYLLGLTPKPSGAKPCGDPNCRRSVCWMQTGSL